MGTTNASCTQNIHQVIFKRSEKVKLFSQLNRGLKNHLIVGDFNEESPLMHNSGTTTSASYDELITEHDMVLLNDGTRTRSQ